MKELIDVEKFTQLKPYQDELESILRLQPAERTLRHKCFIEAYLDFTFGVLIGEDVDFVLPETEDEG